MCRYAPAAVHERTASLPRSHCPILAWAYALIVRFAEVWPICRLSAAGSVPGGYVQARERPAQRLRGEPLGQRL